MYPELHNRRVLLGNRDEFLLRPASRAAWRSRTREHLLETDLVHGNILCGVDLLAGGTWMGITRSGSFAALTNVYEIASTTAHAGWPSSTLAWRAGYEMAGCTAQ